MGARLNRVDPRQFMPVVLRDCNGKEFTRMPGQPRKVPRETRKQLYQLDLAVRETLAEIRSMLFALGVQTKRNQTAVMTRIRRERGA